MKLLLILPALTASVYASLAQNELLGRAIDPANMNPTQLSVLSVLKTALASVSLPSTPLPSDAPEPEWFAKLPKDVKSLLPEFYPATPVVSVAAVDATPTAEFTALSHAPSITGTGSLFPSVNGTLTTGAPSASATTSAVSGGVRNTVGTEALAAVMWFAVGAGFCLFA